MHRFVIGILISIMAMCCLHPAFATDDNALFWAIESEQGHAGYLLGTIHSEDPRVLEFTQEFLSALNSSSSFAMELVPNLLTLNRLAETMHLPAGTGLASVIGDDRFGAVVAALDSYGVPRSHVARMKPWAAMMTLSIPPPKTGFFMDFSLSLRASGNGLKVIGLETLDEQLAFLENMPLEHQLVMLDQAVAEIGQVQAMHERLVTIYLGGDLGALQAETVAQLSTLGEAAREFFLAEGINARNHRMLASLIEAMRSGSVFTAVGALHLPGDQGLISLLRQKGFRLRPMPMPFPER